MRESRNAHAKRFMREARMQFIKTKVGKKEWRGVEEEMEDEEERKPAEVRPKRDGTVS